MAKVGAKKKQKKPNKKEQYERFQRVAGDLDIDNESSAQNFEQTFSKVVPPKRKSELR